MEKKAAPHLPSDTSYILALAKDIQLILTAYNIKNMKIRNRFAYLAKSCKSCQKQEDELPVYSNLVVTPSQMLKMSEKGIPISAQNTSFQPSDGEKNPSFELPLDRLRGVDPAAMWENSQVIKQKAKSAHVRDRKRYGDNLNNE